MLESRVTGFSRHVMLITNQCISLISAQKALHKEAKKSQRSQKLYSKHVFGSIGVKHSNYLVQYLKKCIMQCSFLHGIYIYFKTSIQSCICGGLGFIQHLVFLQH